MADRLYSKLSSFQTVVRLSGRKSHSIGVQNGALSKLETCIFQCRYVAAISVIRPAVSQNNFTILCLSAVRKYALLKIFDCMQCHGI